MVQTQKVLGTADANGVLRVTEEELDELFQTTIQATEEAQPEVFLLQTAPIGDQTTGKENVFPSIADSMSETLPQPSKPASPLHEASTSDNRQTGQGSGPKEKKDDGKGLRSPLAPLPNVPSSSSSASPSSQCIAIKFSLSSNKLTLYLFSDYDNKVKKAKRTRSGEKHEEDSLIATIFAKVCSDQSPATEVSPDESRWVNYGTNYGRELSKLPKKDAAKIRMQMEKMLYDAQYGESEWDGIV